MAKETDEKVTGINALGGIFKDLGSDGQRLKATLVTMSEQLPMLHSVLHLP